MMLFRFVWCDGVTCYGVARVVLLPSFFLIVLFGLCGFIVDTVSLCERPLLSRVRFRFVWV